MRRDAIFGVLRPVLLWIFLVSVIAYLSFCSSISGTLGVLRHSNTAVGIVSGLHPEEHRRVDVTYEVEGKTYKTSTSFPDSSGLPAFDEIRTGDQCRVTYSPENPSFGLLGDPKKVLATNLEELAVISALLAVAAIVFEIRFRRSRRRAN
jgi:hypothetical protein